MQHVIVKHHQSTNERRDGDDICPASGCGPRDALSASSGRIFMSHLEAFIFAGYDLRRHMQAEVVV